MGNAVKLELGEKHISPCFAEKAKRRKNAELSTVLRKSSGTDATMRGLCLQFGPIA